MRAGQETTTFFLKLYPIKTSRTQSHDRDNLFYRIFQGQESQMLKKHSVKTVMMGAQRSLSCLASQNPSHSSPSFEPVTYNFET